MELKLLNFEIAINNILKEDRAGNNYLPDSLSFSYLHKNKDKIIERIVSNLKNSNYKPQQLLEIDVPKPNFTIRPMGRPMIDDWIIYQAIVDFLVNKIAKKISERSFSVKNFTKKKNERMSWLDFAEESKLFYKRGYNYVVISDITGYFEHIKIEELKNKLLNYFTNNDNHIDIVNFLCNNLLRNWNSQRIEGFGLPQGPTASAFLGDVYLDTIDREMSSLSGYFRYMDDIRIFCKSEIDAKKALIRLIQVLRKYKLSINAKKTKLISYKDIERRLLDPKKTQLDAIQKAFDSKNKDRIQAIIPILIDDIFVNSFNKENEFSKTHLNFSIFRIKILKATGLDFDENKVINLILENFANKPHVADEFCAFLTFFKSNRKIGKFLFDFLKNKNNIYEWQEIHILRCILELNTKLTKTIKKIFLKKFKDKNNHWALRSLYCLLVGKHGDNKDRELIKDEFKDSDNNDSKRNILLAIQELGIGSKTGFYKKIKNSNQQLSEFIDYIKSLKSPMYFKPYEKIKINEIDLIKSSTRY